MKSRCVSIGTSFFAGEKSRSFSPKSKTSVPPSDSRNATAEPEAPVPNVEERTSENASKFIRDRQIFIGQRRGTRRTYPPWEPDIWSTSETAARPGGGGGRSREILRTKLQSAEDGITSRYYERTRNCDTRIYFSSPPFQKTKHELSRHAPGIRPKCHFALDLFPPCCVFASPVACTRFYSEIAPNILLGRITPRAKYFRAIAFHAEVRLKKYLADFAIIEIFEYSLYPNYYESHL